MVSLNVQKISLNVTEIKKITEYANSPEVASLLTKSGNKILKKAIPKLPFNRNKRYNKSIPLNQSFKVYAPKSKIQRLNGEKIAIQTVSVKPKKRQKYYFVTMSGKNTYHTKSGTIKKTLNYSNQNSVPFVMEKEMRAEVPNFAQEAINDIKKIITKMKVTGS